MDEQDKVNMLKQIEHDNILHQMYGTRYLLKPDGTIVLRYPDGQEGPIPKYEEYEDE